MTEIESFPVSIPEHDLEDLRERLGRVWVPDPKMEPQLGAWQ